MKKLLSFVSLLLALSFFTISPLYAAAHEKKTGDAVIDVADPEQMVEGAAKSPAIDASNKNKAEEDEEPDCD